MDLTAREARDREKMTDDMVEESPAQAKGSKRHICCQLKRGIV